MRQLSDGYTYGEVPHGTTEADGFAKIEATFGRGKTMVRLTGKGTSLKQLIDWSK